jgi:uncharacterized membrane protein
MAGALGVYAVGVSAGVSLAMAATFRLGGLSVALALQTPALAHLAHRLRVPELRLAAAAVAVVVLARLALNPWLVDYPLGTTPILNGLLWMYGVPALAFGVAARAPEAEGRIRMLFEAGALLFAVGLVTLEIRHAIGGGRLDGGSEIAEIGLDATLWLGVALALHVADGMAPNPVWRWGWRVLGGLGALATLFALVIANPLGGGISVGAWPLFNDLALLYLLPALLAAGFAWSTAWRGQQRLSTVAGVAALVLGFVWVSFEIARAFRDGGRFEWGWTDSVGQGESYAYSAAWLAYGAALLAGGIRFRVPALRWAALAVLAASIFKVFIFDTSTLTGLWRVASFLGLGVALLLLGWIYQRFVPRAPRPSSA